VTLSVEYPDAATGLDRWLPLVKWLLAIPHVVVLIFLQVAAIGCVIIAWFAILFTGRCPRSLDDLEVGLAFTHSVSYFTFQLVKRFILSAMSAQLLCVGSTGKQHHAGLVYLRVLSVVLPVWTQP